MKKWKALGVKNHIVIGAGFGDEGKGATVDYLVRESLAQGRNPLVVRFSGGPQAGHTVHTKYGKKHVFSHYTSGMLQGVDGYWSEYCPMEPGSLKHEHLKLQSIGVDPYMAISTECPVITPFDRWSGRQVDMKNGTCGHGVGATMRRNETSPYRLFVGDLHAPSWVLDHKMKQIQQYYGIELVNQELGLEIEMFREYVKWYTEETYTDRATELSEEYNDFIFEGSQGLLLDRNIGLFPHVTYATTTSRNARKIIEESKLGKDITTYYVTRSYKTRHGNGPMGNTTEPTLINTEGETNVTNPYQGEFRKAAFDLDLFNWAINQDDDAPGNVRRIVVTCMDQHPGNIPIIKNGKLELMRPSIFIDQFPSDTLFSYNPILK